MCKSYDGALDLKIGVISDSHDNIPVIEKALDILNSEKVDCLLHAGDIVSPFSAKLFLGQSFTTYLTFGNNDGEKIMLKDVLSQSERCKLIWPRATINLNHFKIALIHGEDEEIVEAIALSNVYDLVAYGHWHKVVNRVIGKSILVNPGELCGYLSGRRTLAIVDLVKKETKIIDI
jgi:putative phosphoesterase